MMNITGLELYNKTPVRQKVGLAVIQRSTQWGRICLMLVHLLCPQYLIPPWVFGYRNGEICLLTGDISLYVRTMWEVRQQGKRILQ